MKITTHLFAAVAVSALFAGAAAAQTHSSNAQTSSSTATAQTSAQVGGSTDAAPMESTTSGEMSSPSMSVDTSSSTMGSSDSAVNPPAAGAIPVSSGALGDSAALKAGDPGVVSNGPVPDTAENRAKYGQPMSNAGKRSRAAGN